MFVVLRTLFNRQSARGRSPGAAFNSPLALNSLLALTPLLALTLLLALATSPAAAAGKAGTASHGDKIVLGWLQSIRLLPHKLRLTAKLDTGAKSNVMHAKSIELFQQGGREWARFVVPVEKKKETIELTFELPVVDTSRVKQHNSKALDERYVVEMEFCIDGEVYKSEFSLDNREKFNYPVLLGRDFLRRHFIVDPAKTFVKRYHCHAPQQE